MEASSIILPESLTLSSHKRAQGRSIGTVPPSLLTTGFDLDEYLADEEKKLLQQALDQAHGVKFKAAELLGISFRSFRYRLIKHKLASEDEN